MKPLSTAEARYRQALRAVLDVGAESLYHIRLCRARRGDARGAVQAWQDTQRIYPGTQWAGYAGERLAEVGKGAGG